MTKGKPNRLPPNPHISVVVTSRNEGKRLRATVENLQDTLPAKGEILVVDDGSTDGSTRFITRRPRRGVKVHRKKGLGVARARNWGASHTRGDVVVFADAHIVLKPGWWKPLLELLENPRVGASAPGIDDLRHKNWLGFGLTLPSPNLAAKWMDWTIEDPRPVAVLPGCCMAMRRETFEATGGMDESLLVSGGVDNEFCVRLWLLGYELWISPDTVVSHHFRRRSPYPISWTEAVHNRLRLALIHLSPKRTGKAVRALSDLKGFDEAVARVLEGNVSERRAQLSSQKVRGDDWFFEKFGIHW